MSVQVIMNIGLDAGTYMKERVRRNPLIRAKRSAAEVLESFGACYVERHESDLEREATLVVVTHVPTTEGLHTRIGLLSEFLEQDCIAYKVAGVGLLAGPYAERWGPFNEQYFVNPTVEFPS